MDNINQILNRQTTENDIKNILINFDELGKDTKFKKGIYIYGSPGCGKTEFIKKIIKELEYDIIHYDAGDVRNKALMDSITSNNISTCNVLDMMRGKKRNIVLVMDEIDGLNNGDKGGINALIKLIRPKKTKKQRNEEVCNSPIICISNHHTDKKIKELMKVCHVFELPYIGVPQLHEIVKIVMPATSVQCRSYIAHNIQGDLRRVATLHAIYTKCPERVTMGLLKTIMFPKCCNDDTKQITTKLFSTSHNIEDHNIIMNETDRTIVGLLWHENVIDILQNIPNKEYAISMYLQFLANMCYSDYIDRITFQKQIWQFNELSSLMKTFYNSHILHNSTIRMSDPVLSSVRFTKVLTKYSTEYNNSLFIHNMCQQVGMDKKDMFLFFRSLSHDEHSDERTTLSDNYDITKLDISRIDRYLDKHISDIVDTPVMSTSACDGDGDDIDI